MIACQTAKRALASIVTSTSVLTVKHSTCKDWVFILRRKFQSEKVFKREEETRRRIKSRMIKSQPPKKKKLRTPLNSKRLFARNLTFRQRVETVMVRCRLAGQFGMAKYTISISFVSYMKLHLRMQARVSVQSKELRAFSEVSSMKNGWHTNHSPMN